MTLRSGAVWVVLCLAYAGSPPAYARSVHSLQETRVAGVVIQKWDNSCGAAALATILTYHQNHPVSEEQVARGMLRQTDPLQVKHRGGFSLLDMKRFSLEAGFKATGWSGLDIQTLRPRLPAIVPIHVRGYNHFVVVKQLADSEVFIADPGWGNYQMRVDRFQKVWSGIAFTVGKTGEEQG